MGGALIRWVEDRDLPALTRIYNYYVVETPVTFDLRPFEVEERRAWLEGFDATGPYRCFVADVDGVAVGWACSLQFRRKAAYDTSVEASIYLDPEVIGKGLGTRLYSALLESLAGTKIHRILGGVTLPNAASVALHARFGFESVGVFREVGRKFDRYWDVQWFERRLKD
jgi:phosphinothricin acetyltransferase